MLRADEVIEGLGLTPLPGEGGWFRETYRAAEGIPAGALARHGGGARAFSTQIYYLLCGGEASALHRVKSDEVFHHYLGSPVVQLQIDPEDRARVVRIGPDLRAGERPQVVAPAGWWQGACLAEGAGPEAFALLGCTVSPGFEWDDFELADGGECERLAAAAPEHAELIERLRPR